MKNALKWSVSCVGVLCLVLLLGIFIGRRSMRLPSRSFAGEATLTIETTSVQELININAASAEVLQTLPGIGQQLAQRIVDYRQAHGPFKNILQLKLIEGIGDKKLEELIPYIYLEEIE